MMGIRQSLAKHFPRKYAQSMQYCEACEWTPHYVDDGALHCAECGEENPDTPDVSEDSE